MNIIVCIKQVPANTQVKLNPVTNTLIRDGIQSVINIYDMHAIETALDLRETYGGKVTVITMGPPQAEDILKTAIGMTCDEAYLICGREFAGADTLATSYTLAKAIEKIGNVDLIICGKQAVDGDTAQVGPGIAQWLNIPLVSCVNKIESLNGNDIILHRHMDDGTDVVKSTLPALITTVKEINEPRIESIKGKLRAKNYKVTVLDGEALGCNFEQLGLKGSPTFVNKVFVPQRSGNKELLDGCPSDQAKTVISKLRQAQLVV